MKELSDRESEFLARTQRELAVRTAGDEDAIVGAESAFPATVIGWDNPAAETRARPEPPSDRWAYVAAMMEAERAAAQSERGRRRRIGLGIAGAVTLLALAAVLQAFIA